VNNSRISLSNSHISLSQNKHALSSVYLEQCTLQSQTKMLHRVTPQQLSNRKNALIYKESNEELELYRQNAFNSEYEGGGEGSVRINLH
jgi:hypothetical protein